MKKILLLIVALSLILSVKLTAGAEALPETPMTIDLFEYKNADNTPATVLVAGGTLKAEATAKRNVEGNLDALFITAVYDGKGKLFDLQSASFKFTTDASNLFRNTVNIPADTSGVKVKSYFWTNYLEMEPLIFDGDFHSDNADLRKIIIGGREVANISKDVTEYTLELPSSTSATPAVTYVCEDISSNVSVAYSGRDITIISTASGGAQKQYLIHTTLETPRMTNIKTTFSTNTDVVLTPIEGAIHTPDFIYDTDGTTILPFGNELQDRVSFLYADRFHYVYSYPAELEGAYVVGYNYSERPQMRGTTWEFTTTFTLNKSARVYFPCDWAYCSSEGYKNPTAGDYAIAGWTQPQVARLNAGSLEAAQGMAVAYQSIESFPNPINRYIDCIVPAGQDSKTFTIKQSSNSTDTPFLFYKFID